MNKFNDKKIIDINKCDYCETYKLVFNEDNTLIKMENIKLF